MSHLPNYAHTLLKRFIADVGLNKPSKTEHVHGHHYCYVLDSSIRFMSDISVGNTRQQPPIQEAPRLYHSRT